jgi:putative hydrolase of the HAD superfamily
MKALILDFGGPVLRTPFELLRSGERRLGLEPGALGWTGPFDPAADEDWRLLQSGAISERTYWERKVGEFARITGRVATFRQLMGVLFDEAERELVRPEALALVNDARASGLSVAVLTNDLQAFHDPDWVARMRVLDLVDVLVDGSVEGVLKPEAAIYHLALDRLGIRTGDALFVDDQPANVAGAEAVGIESIWLDVTAPATALARARDRLGLAGCMV